MRKVSEGLILFCNWCRLIGKGGNVINKIRHDSGCKIDVLEAVSGATKRCVAVVGAHQSIANGIFLIAERIFDQRKKGGASSSGSSGYTTFEVKASGEVESSECSITLLISNNAIGSIIGKGGVKINATRKDSGARIKISDKPLDDSTEKSVAVAGAPKTVQSALQIICSQLVEEADKVPTIPYVPRPDYAPYYPPTSGGRFDDPYTRDGPRRKRPLFEDEWDRWDGPSTYGRDRDYYGSGSRGYGRPPPPPPPRSAPPSASDQTLVVPVPDYLMGGIIGKNGAAINEIRTRSGSRIKIAALEQGATDRMITITGTPVANELAVAMIHQKMGEK